MTGTRSSPGDDLLAAVAVSWRAAQSRHPDLPDVRITLSGAQPKREPDTMVSYDHTTGQLKVRSPDGKQSAEEYLGAILHAAVHALAQTRSIADTSRQGRYHNRQFQELATELGLDVDEDLSTSRTRATGWSLTSVPAVLAAHYTASVEQLRVSLSNRSAPAPSHNLGLRTARCSCPRRIRVHPSVFALGGITCDVCQSAFVLITPRS